MAQITHRELEELGSLIQDADKCQRLTQFQRAFIDSLQSRIDRYGKTTNISDKQWHVIHGIEATVYAT